MGRVAYIILAVAFALSIHDVFIKVPAEKDSHEESEHDDFAEFDDGTDGKSFSKGTEEDHVEVREQTEFGKPQAQLHVKDLPPMRFLFCVSCGYRNAFEQYSQFITQKYPNMLIEGSNYPPAPWKAYLAQFISFAKIALIVLVVTGQNPFQNLGWGYPAVLQWAQTNKLSACMMIFLLSNMVETSLISTGAFEIYLGDEQIWSKIDSGRVPSPGELLQMVDQQLAILGKIPSTTGFNEGFDQVA